MSCMNGIRVRNQRSDSQHRRHFLAVHVQVMMCLRRCLNACGVRCLRISTLHRLMQLYGALWGGPAVCGWAPFSGAMDAFLQSSWTFGGGAIWWQSLCVCVGLEHTSADNRSRHRKYVFVRHDRGQYVASSSVCQVFHRSVHRVLPDDQPTEPTEPPTEATNKFLEEAWVAAEVAPEAMNEEDEERLAADAAEAEGAQKMSGWAGWDRDNDEEEEEEVKEETPPATSPGKGKGKGKGGGRGAFRAGLNRMGGFTLQEIV